MVVNANTPSSSPQSSPSKSKEEEAVNSVPVRDLSSADAELSGAMNKNLQELTSSGNSMDPSGSSVDPREADGPTASVAEDGCTKAHMKNVDRRSTGSEPETPQLAREMPEKSGTDARSEVAGSSAGTECTPQENSGAQADEAFMKQEDAVSDVGHADLKLEETTEHGHKGDDHISDNHANVAGDQKWHETATHCKESQTDKRSCSVSDAEVSHSEIDDEIILKSPGAAPSGESCSKEENPSPVHNKRTQTPHKSGEGLPRSPNAQRGAAAVLAMLVKKQEKSSPDKADAKNSQEAEEGGAEQSVSRSTSEPAEHTELQHCVDQKPSNIPNFKESHNPEAMTTENHNGTTKDSADVKPSDSADVKPSDSADVKPCDSAEAKPCDSAEAKPCDSAEAKPCDSAEGKPRAEDNSAEAKPCDSAEAKPCDSAEAKPCDSAEAKPCDSAEAKPCDSAEAKPCDSAEAKPSDSVDGNKPCDSVDAKTPDCFIEKTENQGKSLENPEKKTLVSSDIASGNPTDKLQDGTDTPSKAVEAKEEEKSANIVDEIIAGSTKTIE